MILTLWGINHKTAPVSLRERLAVPETKLEKLIQSLRQCVNEGEVFLLSTCNRTEICVLRRATTVNDRLSINSVLNNKIVQWLEQWSSVQAHQLEPVLYVKQDKAAVEHLIAVCAGLDSLVIGEPQIFGQMKDAYARAHQLNAIQSSFEYYFQFIFKAAKRIRRETEIGMNSVSVASAAIMLSKQVFSQLSELNCLLVGAGKMINLVAQHLSTHGFRHLSVANRSIENAHKIADQYGGLAMTIDEVPVALEKSDLVICCTAASLPIIGKGMVEAALKKRRYRPMLMIDLAVPRDIEPAVEHIDSIYLYTVDDLQQVVDQNQKNRELAADQAKIILAEEIDLFYRQQNLRKNADDITAYRSQIEYYRQKELDKAKQELDKGADPLKVMERLTRSLSNKIMHVPTAQLRLFAEYGYQDKLVLARQILGVSESFQNDDCLENESNDHPISSYNNQNVQGAEH